jgi:predicted transcriptional regulator
MSTGFSKENIEVSINKKELSKILKDYKKIKKYMKSPLYTIKKIDGTEEIVTELLKELEENPM